MEQGEAAKGKGEAAEGRGDAAKGREEAAKGRETAKGGEALKGKEDGYVKPCFVPSTIQCDLACICMSVTEWEGSDSDLEGRRGRTCRA